MTLIELAVTLALVAIALAIGLPGLRMLLQSQRVDAAATALAESLRLARSEALRTGRRTTLCPSVDGASCGADAGWEAGWILFSDPDAALAPRPGEPLLQAHRALDGVTVRTSASLAHSVSFTAQGWPRTPAGALQAGSFVVSGPGGGRSVVLSPAGRVRSAEPGE